MIVFLCVASFLVSVSTETVCPDATNRIQTEPVLSNNILANNYFGLKLSYKFISDGNNVIYAWSHPNLTPSQTTIYSQTINGSCNNNNESGFHVTCQQATCGESTVVTTSLDLRFLLNRSVKFAVKHGTTMLDHVDVMIRDCNISSGRSLKVVSESSDYDAKGEFTCRNDGSLFYSNGSKIVSNTTKCLASAEWKNSDIVQCWTAPLNVFVAGNMNVTEGNNINLSCEHQSEFPASNGSLFLFNGTETYVDEPTPRKHMVIIQEKDDWVKMVHSYRLQQNGGNFTIWSVQKENHNQSVFCQIQSPYVELVDPSSGRSQQRFINVLYPPVATSLPKQCTWETNATGICNISFESNPNAQFRSILFNEMNVTSSSDSNNLFQSLTTRQYFTYIRKKVSKTFTGTYKLVLYSNEFGETTIPFHINVVDRLPSDQTVVIVVAVLGSVAVVATAALLIRIYLNTKKKADEKLEVENVLYDSRFGDNDEKLNVENVIYVATTDAGNRPDYLKIDDTYSSVN